MSFTNQVDVKADPTQNESPTSLLIGCQVSLTETHGGGAMKINRGAVDARVLTALSLVIGLAGCASTPMKEAVVTKDAPAPIGPYSQGVKIGTLVFLSGQTAIDPKTNQLSAGSIEEQTKQALDNLDAILRASGMTMESVVNTTVFMKDVNDFAKMNAVYATYFKDKPPARATVQVARLPRDALVEISAIAVK
jgi:2-iminobutanoate/2-iminopropanoate deaminase